MYCFLVAPQPLPLFVRAPRFLCRKSPLLPTVHSKRDCPLNGEFITPLGQWNSLLGLTDFPSLRYSGETVHGSLEVPKGLSCLSRAMSPWIILFFFSGCEYILVLAPTVPLKQEWANHSPQTNPATTYSSMKTLMEAQWHSLIYVVSMAAFVLWRQSWVLVAETICFIKLKILTDKVCRPLHWSLNPYYLKTFIVDN